MGRVPVVLVLVLEAHRVLGRLDPLVQLLLARVDDPLLGLLGQLDPQLLTQHGEEHVLEGDVDDVLPERVPLLHRGGEGVVLEQLLGLLQEGLVGGQRGQVLAQANLQQLLLLRLRQPQPVVSLQVTDVLSRKVLHGVAVVVFVDLLHPLLGGPDVEGGPGEEGVSGHSADGRVARELHGQHHLGGAEDVLRGQELVVLVVLGHLRGRHRLLLHVNLLVAVL